MAQARIPIRRRVMPAMGSAARSGAVVPAVSRSRASGSRSGASSGSRLERRDMAASVATCSWGVNRARVTTKLSNERARVGVDCGRYRTSVRMPLGDPTMRLYAPADPTTVLDGLLEEPSLARGVVHHAVLPPREAVYAAMPPWLDPRIVNGLAGRGIEQLYSHQAEAIDAVHAGEDVVVVTPTASGKTLCYSLPALQ